MVQGLDTPAYLLPVIAQITQLLWTRQSVITLGHTMEQPLMCPASELVDGYEPHDHIYSAVVSGAAVSAVPVLTVGAEEVYPGWCWEGGIPGTNMGPERR